MAKSKYINLNKADYRAGFTQHQKYGAGFTPTPNFGVSLQGKRGFTLMEIIVATAIFAVVSLAMLSLFNSTLKINRKSEALRQATQGVRNFAEFLIKTIRNGEVDYSVNHTNLKIQNPVVPCPKANPLVGADHDGSNSYQTKENRLGLITPEGERWCLFLGDINGNWPPPSSFVGETLVLQKETGFKQILNPPYYKVENLMFIIRPLEDPYYSGSGGLIRTQPAVSLFMKVVAQLPSGETFPIYYQTSVSSDKYDIPNN